MNIARDLLMSVLLGVIVGLIFVLWECIWDHPQGGEGRPAQHERPVFQGPVPQETYADRFVRWMVRNNKFCTIVGDRFLCVPYDQEDA